MKYAGKIISVLLVLAMGQTVAFGEDSPMPKTSTENNITNSSLPDSTNTSDWLAWARRDTLTGDWGGIRNKLEESGVTFNLGFTQVYQQSLRGGLSTHRHAGRYSGRYDLELDFDLEKLFNCSGASIYALARGGWSNGIDEYSVGSLFGTNAVAVGDRSIDVWQLYLEQSFLNKDTFLRIGKIDLTGEYDASAFANDEASQFLNGSLVNNPTIPFPDPGLAAMVHIEPVGGWYLSAAIADADADVRETGFNSAFRSPGNFLGILETGFLTQLSSNNGPLEGAYRIGIWYDHQAKDHLNGNRSKSNDIGWHLSLDQMIFKENRNNDDSQGLGVFARLGFADRKVNEIHTFWSIGAQYQGLIPNRDDDVVGLGVSQGRLSDHAGFTTSNETAVELYYNAQITPWLNLSPSIQYVSNPGGNKDVDNTVVAGFRIQMSF
jgi:porin